MKRLIQLLIYILMIIVVLCLCWIYSTFASTQLAFCAHFEFACFLEV
jgi:hypothetical protein